MSEPLQIGLLIFPKITQLDMTGPYEAFARIPGVKVHLIWKRIEPITSDVGMPLLPTMTLRECPPLEVICIPGGPGQVDLMDDEEIIAFVRRQGLQARYVTSVCTGARCSARPDYLTDTMRRRTGHQSTISRISAQHR